MYPSYPNPYSTPSSHPPPRYPPPPDSHYSPGNPPPKRYDPFLMENAFKEIQNKYDSHLNSNLRTGAALSELEMILDGERRKTKDIKDKLEVDLENERRMRIDFENKMIKLKDEALKREMLLSELDFKVNNLSHENASVLAENGSLKEELSKYQEIYNLKLREMEEKFANQMRRAQAMEDDYRGQIGKIQSENKSYLDELNGEWEKRYRAVDEKCMKLIGLKQELETELKKMNDLVLRVKMEAEEAIRETISKMQEEEYRKYMSNLKSIENKLMATEETKSVLAKKNQEFINELQVKDRELRQNQLNFDNTLNKYKQEISDLQNQFNQVDILVNKYRAELNNKENVIGRMEAEFAEVQKSIAKLKENNKNEIESAIREHNNEKRYLEDTVDQQKRKILELENVIHKQESDLSRMKAEYDRICNMLQNNINKTIFQTMTEASSFPGMGAGAGQGNLGKSQVGRGTFGKSSNGEGGHKLIYKYE